MVGPRAVACPHTAGAGWERAAGSSLPYVEEAKGFSLERRVTELGRRQPEDCGERLCRAYLLGPLRVTREDERIEGGWRRKALELLAYLAAHRRGAPKDQILEALWPWADPKTSQAALWRSVSHLRSRLRGPEGHTVRFIERVDDLYRLDLNRIWVDAIAFEAAVRRAELVSDPLPLIRTACDLYRGEFCEGRYYSWATPVQERMRNLFVRAAGKLTAWLEERGDWASALATLDRAIGSDPYNEVLYRHAMRLEAARGRRDLVARRFRRLRRLLLDELELEPAAETILSLERLVEQKR